ncbi:MAG: type II restriction endonuclease, partial [Brevundimonas sp.]|nr:type II restriction endonuclease [Brevundimonas sp.]
TTGAILARVVENVGEIDALMLSASQQRRSRAGYSFEHHIEAMLLAGRVPFEKQVIIDAKKRPDFILPSWKFLSEPGGDGQGFILSAKTTLRERWKQVQREMSEHALFLATVDDSLAGNAIDDMASMGITLVVPEILTSASSTAAKAAEYRGHSNVITFRQFFDTEIRDKRLRHWPPVEHH